MGSMQWVISTTYGNRHKAHYVSKCVCVRVCTCMHTHVASQLSLKSLNLWTFQQSSQRSNPGRRRTDFLLLVSRTIKVRHQVDDVKSQVIHSLETTIAMSFVILPKFQTVAAYKTRHLTNTLLHQCYQHNRSFKK